MRTMTLDEKRKQASWRIQHYNKSHRSISWRFAWALFGDDITVLDRTDAEEIMVKRFVELMGEDISMDRLQHTGNDIATNCARCIHDDICRYKEDYRVFLESLDDFLDNDVFKVNVYCRHFSGKSAVRGKERGVSDFDSYKDYYDEYFGMKNPLGSVPCDDVVICTPDGKGE